MRLWAIHTVNLDSVSSKSVRFLLIEDTTKGVGWGIEGGSGREAGGTISAISVQKSKFFGEINKRKLADFLPLGNHSPVQST